MRLSPVRLAAYFNSKEHLSSEDSRSPSFFVLLLRSVGLSPWLDLHSSIYMKPPLIISSPYGVFLSKFYFFNLLVASSIFDFNGDISCEYFPASRFGVLFYTHLNLSLCRLLLVRWCSCWSPKLDCASDKCLLVIERGLTSGYIFMAFLSYIMLAL